MIQALINLAIVMIPIIVMLIAILVVDGWQ